jgi:hypothetical protein
MVGDQNELRRKALMDQMGGIAPGEDAPNAGAPPMLDPIATAPPSSPIGTVPDAGGPLAGVMPATSAPRNNTRLMEGDAGKLADVGHAAKSPKYDFLQLANQGKYGYDQLGDMLAELQQGPNAKHWQGWTAEKDKLHYTGDPNALGSEWGGVKTVDTIGGFGADGSNASGFRWGVDDPSAQAGQQGQGGQMPGDLAMQALSQVPKFGGQQIDPRLEGDPLQAILQALSQMGGGAPNQQALLNQLRG